jgi:hypothetical protein
LKAPITAAVAAGALAALATAPQALAAPGQTYQGPSSSAAPYVIPADDAVTTASINTTGDAVGGYRFGGIQDGLGAFDHHGHTFRLVANHELGEAAGVIRRHGEKGAYVSDWTIDRNTLEVTAGSDFIAPKTGDLATTGVRYWDYSKGAYSTSPSSGSISQLAAFSRFCSSTLTDPGQLAGPQATGYRGQLYFGTEEGGSGRIFGITEDGVATQLPRLGLYNAENVKPGYTDQSSLATTVVGLEDATAPLWLYRGTKQRTGTAVERAGLTNGDLGVLALDRADVKNDDQFRAAFGKNNPVSWHFASVNWNQSSAAQHAEAASKGGTLFTRIEDGTWDPRHPDTFYFNTTSSTNKSPEREVGGTWKLVLDDVNDPAKGGTVELLLDGSEPVGLNMQDNLTIDSHGNLLIQEDPGNKAHIARIVAYNTKTGAARTVAKFDPRYFAPKLADGSANPELITTDEESSGIIPADNQLGRDTYLFDAQVHKAYPDATLRPELVEMGQLLAMKVDWKRFWGADDAS